MRRTPTDKELEQLPKFMQKIVQKRLEKASTREEKSKNSRFNRFMTD
ncbi:MAG: hypothetical protein ACTSQF_04845 [Candidatus Heimdallarchaeaceae archaeon]